MIGRTYRSGRVAIMKGQVDHTDGSVMCQLVGTGSSFFTDSNPANMSSFTSLIPVGTAAALTSPTIFDDSDLDRAVFQAVSPTFSGITDTIIGAVLYSGTIALYGILLGAPVNPDGSDYTFPFATDGIAEL